MKRRYAYSFALLLLIVASAAHARTFAEAVEQQLRALGYAEVTVSRTFLGRTRLFATGENGTREIIIDPRNGEILRDVIKGPGNVVLIGQLRLDDDPPEGGGDPGEGGGDSDGGSGDDDGGGDDDGAGDDGSDDEEEDDGSDDDEEDDGSDDEEDEPDDGE